MTWEYKDEIEDVFFYSVIGKGGKKVDVGGKERVNDSWQ